MGRRIALRIAAVAVVITAVAVPTAAVVNRSRFGTFAFWELPDRIDHCGRRDDADADSRATPGVTAQVCKHTPPRRT